MNKTLNTKEGHLSKISEKSRRVIDFLNEHDNKYDLEPLLEEFYNLMDEKCKSKKTKDIMGVFEMADKVQRSLGLDNHIHVSEIVNKEYSYLIKDFIVKTEEEYQCKTAIEKSLAELIALSHIKIITISKTMNYYLSGKTAINKDVNDFYSVISKELDQAHRQLTNSIITLRQMKVSTSSFSVNAKTAFIAQNQQINSNNKINEC